MHTFLHVIIIMMAIITLVSLWAECSHVSQWTKKASIAAFCLLGAALAAMALFDPWHWPTLAVLSMILVFEFWVARSTTGPHI